MISSLEEFERAYATATPTQKYLCSQSGSLLWSIAEKHGITNPEKYGLFAQIVGDIVLGIQPVSSISTLISENIGVDMTVSNNITRDLLDFLAPLSDPNWTPPQTELELGTELAAAEAALGTLPQVRTMPQAPVGSEPVYTSTQAAILHESTVTPSAAAPSATAASAPRWDSEPS